jgi:hypothetical protein
MSSAEAMIDEAVVVASVGRNRDARRAVTALAVIAVMQLTWLAALVYGTFRLLS